MELLKRKKTGNKKNIATKMQDILVGAGKEARLKKKLFKNLTLYGGIVIILLVLSFGVSSYNEDNIAHKNTLSAQVSGLRAELTQLQQKIFKVEKAMPIYQELFQDKQDEHIGADRQLAKSVIEKLKNQYMFTTMKLTMSPVKPVVGAEFSNQWTRAEYTDIAMTIEAITDTHVMQFIEALRKELPGVIKVTSLTLGKLSEARPEITKSIEATGKVALVKADIKLEWYGMQMIKAETPADANAVPGAGAPQ